MLMMLLKDRVEDRLQVMAAAVSSAEGAAPPGGGGVGAGPDMLEPTFSPYNATTTDDTTTGVSGQLP